jgi:hypothetical protein
MGAILTEPFAVLALESHLLLIWSKDCDMDADEREICTYLKSWRGQFVAGKEIARRASGKSRFRVEPHWAVPVLARLVEKGLVEADSTGHFRLRSDEKKEKKQWVSPEIKKLLEKSKQGLSETIEIADESGENEGH